MLIAEVQEPEAKVLTGQKRSNYNTKQKRKERSTTTKSTVPEKKGRETQEPKYQRKS
jgi:hypothetical protein